NPLGVSISAGPPAVTRPSGHAMSTMVTAGGPRRRAHRTHEENPMRPWWPLVAVCLGTFMLLVDVTIVNVALPPIAASLGTSFGGWGAVNGLAAAAGPLLGGLLTQTWGWRAIFLVNLPVAVFALALTLAVVSESAPTAAGRVDVLGAATFTVTSAALVYGL